MYTQICNSGGCKQKSKKPALIQHSDNTSHGEQQIIPSGSPDALLASTQEAKRHSLHYKQNSKRARQSPDKSTEDRPDRSNKQAARLGKKAATSANNVRATAASEEAKSNPQTQVLINTYTDHLGVDWVMDRNCSLYIRGSQGTAITDIEHRHDRSLSMCLDTINFTGQWKPSRFIMRNIKPGRFVNSCSRADTVGKVHPELRWLTVTMQGVMKRKVCVLLQLHVHRPFSSTC